MSSTPAPIDHSLDNESRVPEAIAILVVGSVLSNIAVCLRVFTRWRILNKFGWDDGTMVIAQIFTLGTGATIAVETYYGLGRHSWAIPPSSIVPYIKAFYSSIVVYNIGLCLVKCSILLQYKRIFVDIITQRLCKAGLVFIGLWGFTLCFLLTMGCVPVEKHWDPTVEGHCINTPPLWYFISVVNLLTDIAVLIMPLPMVKSLLLPRRQKIMLAGIFLLGIFPVAVSLYRFRALHDASINQDEPWDNVDAAACSYLEITIAVFVACLPTLRAFFMRYFPRVFASSGAGSTGNQGHGISSADNIRCRRSQWPRVPLNNDSAVPSTKSSIAGTDEEKRGSFAEQERAREDLESGGFKDYIRFPAPIAVARKT